MKVSYNFYCETVTFSCTTWTRSWKKGLEKYEKVREFHPWKKVASLQIQYGFQKFSIKITIWWEITLKTCLKEPKLRMCESIDAAGKIRRRAKEDLASRLIILYLIFTRNSFNLGCHRLICISYSETIQIEEKEEWSKSLPKFNPLSLLSLWMKYS